MPSKCAIENCWNVAISGRAYCEEHDPVQRERRAIDAVKAYNTEQAENERIRRYEQELDNYAKKRLEEIERHEKETLKWLEKYLPPSDN